jgi:hypothetical protein
VDLVLGTAAELRGGRIHGSGFRDAAVATGKRVVTFVVLRQLRHVFIPYRRDR